MRVLGFILLNIFCINLSFATTPSGPTQTEYDQAVISVTDYLVSVKTVNAYVECEDYRADIIVCNAYYTVNVSDSVDLEEDGIREESYDLQCADTYAFNRKNADVQELESECY